MLDWNPNLTQWTKAKKIGILIVVSVYSFLGNSALSGPAVYLVIYSLEFNIDVNTASHLISYPNLAYGFGELKEPGNGGVSY